MKFFKKPVYKFKELPFCIQNEVIRFGILCAIILFALVLYSIKIRTLIFIFYGVILLLIGIVAILFWYLKFAYDKVIYVEGTIIKIEDENNGINKKLKKTILKLTRPKCLLQLENGEVLSVAKTSRKMSKTGTYVRIYFIPDSLIETSNKRLFLNASLYVEILN